MFRLSRELGSKKRILSRDSNWACVEMALKGDKRRDELSRQKVASKNAGIFLHSRETEPNSPFPHLEEERRGRRRDEGNRGQRSRRVAWNIVFSSVHSRQQVRSTYHDATHSNERSSSKTPLLSSEKTSNGDVSSSSNLSVGLNGHSSSQVVDHQRLMSLRESELPWQSSVLDSGPSVHVKLTKVSLESGLRREKE